MLKKYYNIRSIHLYLCYDTKNAVIDIDFVLNSKTNLLKNIQWRS